MYINLSMFTEHMYNIYVKKIIYFADYITKKKIFFINLDITRVTKILSFVI